MMLETLLLQHLRRTSRFDPWSLKLQGPNPKGWVKPRQFAGKEGGPCPRCYAEWLPSLRRGQGPPSLPANYRMSSLAFHTDLPHLGSWSGGMPASNQLHKCHFQPRRQAVIKLGTIRLVFRPVPPYGPALGKMPSLNQAGFVSKCIRSITHY
jgi:hypothetical protein